MTRNKEDYLKAIYHLGGEYEMVSNKSIAEELKVAPPSVTEMLARMKKDGLIEIEPYRGTRLTEKGLKRCLALIRSHGLWEVFLMRCLGFSWKEAHEEAHLLEHAASPRMMEKLDEFLNFPQFDLQDSTVSSEQRELRGSHVLPLSEMREGQTAHIRKLVEGEEIMEEFLTSGLVLDDVVQMMGRGEDGSFCLSSSRERRITVDSRMASLIYVDIHLKE